jgi:hypothetical protein
MKLGAAVAGLVEAEVGLASELRKVGERHAADHDVFHLTATLAQECDTHADALRPVAERLGASPDDRNSVAHDLAAKLRRGMSTLTGRSEPAALLLLEDLRRLFVLVSDVHIRWLIVGQGAKASRDGELLRLFQQHCEETTGQMRWLTTRIKTAAPQVLTVG